MGQGDLRAKLAAPAAGSVLRRALPSRNCTHGNWEGGEEIDWYMRVSMMSESIKLVMC